MPWLADLCQANTGIFHLVSAWIGYAAVSGFALFSRAGDWVAATAATAAAWQAAGDNAVGARGGSHSCTWRYSTGRCGDCGSLSWRCSDSGIGDSDGLVRSCGYCGCSDGCSLCGIGSDGSGDNSGCSFRVGCGEVGDYGGNRVAFCSGNSLGLGFGQCDSRRLKSRQGCLISECLAGSQSNRQSDPGKGFTHANILVVWQ